MRFRSHDFCAAAIVLAALAAPGAMAQSNSVAPPIYIFTSTGQDAAQQREDRMQCHGWATDQSGYDPSLAALSVHLQSSAPASEDTSDGNNRASSVARGALGGAAVGALIGAVSGDVDVEEGAAYGAGVGAVGGGLRGRQQRTQSENAATGQAESLAAQTRLNLSNYGRAYKTCLEGKGYRIS